MAARTVELIFKGTNRSAVRALSEISTQSEKTTRTLKRDSAESSSSLERMGRSAERTRGMVSGLAGSIGFGGLAFGIKDAIKGGMELQASQAQLQAALRSTGLAAGGTYEKLRAGAEALSQHGGFSNPQNLVALAAFVRETHNVTQAQQMLGLATNIARGRNVDLATAQMMVQRAASGSIGKLQALLGPMIAVKSAAQGLTQAHKDQIFQLELQSKAMGKAGPLWLKQQELLRGITPQMHDLAVMQDKHATATMILAAAQREFGGATAAYANTTAGHLSNLTNTIQNLKDAVGTALLPVMNKLIQGLVTTVEWLGKHKAVLYLVLGATGLFTAALAFNSVVTTLVTTKQILFGTALRGAAVAEGEAGLATRGLSLAMMTLSTVGIFAVITGLVLLVTHFKQVKAAAVDVWHWIRQAGLDLNHFAVGIGQGISHGISGLVHSATFGLLRSGGVVKPKYYDMGGPVGSDTIPGWLTPGEGVLTQRGMSVIGGAAGLNAINNGQAGGQQVIELHHVTKLDSRVLAESITHYALRRAARGPSSLVGGSLVTG